VVAVCIDRCCVVDGLEVKGCLISAMRELSSEDEGMEF